MTMSKNGFSGENLEYSLLLTIHLRWPFHMRPGGSAACCAWTSLAPTEGRPRDEHRTGRLEAHRMVRRFRRQPQPLVRPRLARPPPTTGRLRAQMPNTTQTELTAAMIIFRVARPWIAAVAWFAVTSSCRTTRAIATVRPAATSLV